MHPHNKWFVRQAPSDEGWASREALLDHMEYRHGQSATSKASTVTLELRHYQLHGEAHFHELMVDQRRINREARKVDVPLRTQLVVPTKKGKKVRYYFDTEFYDNGRTIDLISIGMVSEDGSTFYAESAEIDLTQVGDWLTENVVPQLQGGSAQLSKAAIAAELKKFIACGGTPEFWAYYGSYDWVVFCQLFGGMLDLPKSWPKYPLDLKQEANRFKTRLIEQVTPQHHALNDAIWTKHAHEALTKNVESLAKAMGADRRL